MNDLIRDVVVGLATSALYDLIKAIATRLRRTPPKAKHLRR